MTVNRKFKKIRYEKYGLQLVFEKQLMSVIFIFSNPVTQMSQRQS